MDEQMSLRDTKKDSATIEREIDQTRAEMNKTLDALEHRLTAGQLLDQCLNFFGTTGREAGASFGRSLQENPMPVILTATGIAWMMTSRGQRDSSVRDNGERLYGAAAENLSNVSARAKSTASSARDQLARSKDAIKGGVTDTVDAVRQGVSSTASSAQVQARRLQQQFNSALEEQPLVLGAIGLAIGAAIGAMIPSTEQEDRFMGDARDNIVEKGKEIGSKAYEKGRETVNQAVNNTEGASRSNVPVHPET